MQFGRNFAQKSPLVHLRVLIRTVCENIFSMIENQEKNSLFKCKIGNQNENSKLEFKV